MMEFTISEEKYHKLEPHLLAMQIGVETTTRDSKTKVTIKDISDNRKANVCDLLDMLGERYADQMGRHS